MKRLGGWWRIWIVLTVGLLALSTLAALSHKDYSEAFIAGKEPSSLACVPFTKNIGETDESRSALERYESERRSEVINVEGAFVTIGPRDPRYTPPEQRGVLKPERGSEVRCSSWSALTGASFRSLLLSMLIALAALAARWIYFGFKKTLK